MKKGHHIKYLTCSHIYHAIVFLEGNHHYDHIHKNATLSSSTSLLVGKKNMPVNEITSVLKVTDVSVTTLNALH